MNDKKVLNAEGVLRSERIVYLRKKILKLTQKEVEEQLGVPLKTLQNWENVRYDGLTEKGAAKLIEAFKKAGLECSKYWLLDGIGEEPWLTTEQLGKQPLSVIDPNFKKKFPPITSAHSDTNNLIIGNSNSIQEELKIFYAGHPTAIDTVIVDDGLTPCFLPKDHVAGEKLFGEAIEKAVGLACIIQIKPGEIVVRQLGKGKKSGEYTLRCTNPETSIKNAIMAGIKPIFVAPIIWIRKPEIS